MPESNPPAEWRMLKEGYWQYWSPGYAVYGTVAPMDGGERWIWDARVMFECERPDMQRTKGVAKSLEGAKRIVEVVCSETGTCDPSGSEKGGVS